MTSLLKTLSILPLKDKMAWVTLSLDSSQEPPALSVTYLKLKSLILIYKL